MKKVLAMGILLIAAARVDAVDAPRVYWSLELAGTAPKDRAVFEVGDRLTKTVGVEGLQCVVEAPKRVDTTNTISVARSMTCTTKEGVTVGTVAACHIALHHFPFHSFVPGVFLYAPPGKPVYRHTLACGLSPAVPQR